MIIDTHAHLTLEEFNPDRELVLQRAKKAGVTGFIEVGFSIQRSLEAYTFSKQQQGVYCAVGIHPHDAKELENKHSIEKLISIINHDKVIAWGEIGLDYYRDISPREAQKKAFIFQLDTAGEHKLPVIIHCRDAHEDMKKVLAEYKNKEITGVVHSFSGTLQDAEIYCDMGFGLGIGGPVTYPNAKSLREVVKNVSLNNIILETDAPYLPPQPFRGKRNEPSYLKYVTEKISEIKEIDIKEVEQKTTQTAKRVFNINFD